MSIEVESINEACRRAAERLHQARLPLICGLTDQFVETQQVAVDLARLASAAIDWTRGNSPIAIHAALQQTGMVTCTFGEVRDRADLVVVWSSDIAPSHPDFVEQVAKSFVAVGPESKTTQQSTRHFDWNPRDQVAALRWLRLQAQGDVDAQAKGAAASENFGNEVAEFHTMINEATRPVIVFDESLAGQIGDAGILSLFRWIRAQNDQNLCRVVHLTEGINTTGIHSTLSAMTGFPFGVCFRDGLASFRGREFSVSQLIENRLTDLLMLVGNADQLPAKTTKTEAFAAIPKIHIHADSTATELPSTVETILVEPVGEGCGGTLIRDDGVPLEISANKDALRPVACEVLISIACEMKNNYSVNRKASN